MAETIQQRVRVPESLGGLRLDQVAAELFPEFSRARLQDWIRSSALKVDDRVAKPRLRLLGGEWLHLDAVLESQQQWQAESIALDITYEDGHILVLNKPAGLVVHPAAGNYSGTLLNALLHYIPDLNQLPRAGIVHRLDKDTTGLMVVAKTLSAHTDLVAQLQRRAVSREYEAVVQGELSADSYVEAPIGRHPRQRKKMAVVNAGGKEAVTHYRILRRLGAYTHLRLKLETGRTHQIRVHMAHIGHPLVGDPVYRGRVSIPRGADSGLVEILRGFPRQALHAACLGLTHPHSRAFMQWSAPLPEDMTYLLEWLNRYREKVNHG